MTHHPLLIAAFIVSHLLIAGGSFGLALGLLGCSVRCLTGRHVHPIDTRLTRRDLRRLREGR